MEDLITPNRRASRDYLDYTHEFPDLDGLIIVVRSAPDPARAEHFVDALAAWLNADHANVKPVFYKIDAGAFADRAMLYMTSADLDALAQKLRTAFPMLGAYAADPSLAGFFAMVNAGIDRQMQAQMQSRMPAQMQRQMQHRTAASMRASARRMHRAAATGHPDTRPRSMARSTAIAPSEPAAAAAPAAFDLGAIDTGLDGMLADTGGAKYVSPWQSMMQAVAPDSTPALRFPVSLYGAELSPPGAPPPRA